MHVSVEDINSCFPTKKLLQLAHHTQNHHQRPLSDISMDTIWIAIGYFSLSCLSRTYAGSLTSTPPACKRHYNSISEASIIVFATKAKQIDDSLCERKQKEAPISHTRA